MTSRLVCLQVGFALEYWRNNMLKYSKYALLMLMPLTAIASDPDFYIVAHECSILAGSFNNKKLLTIPGKLPINACSRQGKNLVCSVAFQNSSSSVSTPSETYRIFIDSPPFLYYGSDNGAAFFSVNVELRSAVMVIRDIDESYAGAKVCSATYATSSDIEILRKQPESNK